MQLWDFQEKVVVSFKKTLVFFVLLCTSFSSFYVAGGAEHIFNFNFSLEILNENVMRSKDARVNWQINKASILSFVFQIAKNFEIKVSTSFLFSAH